jgi:hypothetical protein
MSDENPMGQVIQIAEARIRNRWSRRCTAGYDYTPSTTRTGFSLSPVPKERFVVTLSGSTYVPKRRSHTVKRLAKFFI